MKACHIEEIFICLISLPRTQANLAISYLPSAIAFVSQALPVWLSRGLVAARRVAYLTYV